MGGGLSSSNPELSTPLCIVIYASKGTEKECIELSLRETQYMARGHTGPKGRRCGFHTRALLAHPAASRPTGHRFAMVLSVPTDPWASVGA